MIFANNTFADTPALNTPTLFAEAEDGFLYAPADRDMEFAYANWYSDYRYFYKTYPTHLPAPWVIFDEEHKLHQLCVQRYKDEMAQEQLETREEAYAQELEAEEMRLMGL